mmetsp:Transcript_45544/g.122770  ORF Transcript_45544/g.122770 Transcript_45544/m.122770 type:complete len:211 (-) Transcript_45544:364-996(-)
MAAWWPIHVYQRADIPVPPLPAPAPAVSGGVGLPVRSDPHDGRLRRHHPRQTQGPAVRGDICVHGRPAHLEHGSRYVGRLQDHDGGFDGRGRRRGAQQEPKVRAARTEESLRAGGIRVDSVLLLRCWRDTVLHLLPWRGKNIGRSSLHVADNPQHRRIRGVHAVHARRNGGWGLLDVIWLLFSDGGCHQPCGVRLEPEGPRDQAHGGAWS